MSNRRWVGALALPVVAAAAWTLLDRSGEERREAPPAFVAEPEPVAEADEAAPRRLPAAPRAEPAVEEAHPQPQAERVRLPEGEAVVVPLGPGDELPGPPPEEHDEPPEPPALPEELPQTPEWKWQKATRMATLLERHADRLEAELEEARRRGDEAEAARLAVRVERQRKRLGDLRREAEGHRIEAGIAAE